MNVKDYQRAVLAWHAVLVTPPPHRGHRKHVIDLWFEGCEFRLETRPHATDKFDNRRPQQ